MPIERFRDNGQPRIIGAAMGGEFADEEAFLAAMAPVASNLSAGLKVLAVYPDGTVVTATRTDIPVPEEGDPAEPLYGDTTVVVDSGFSRWLNSTVRVGMFFPDGDTPVIAWERVIGITGIDNEEQTATYGLVEPNTPLS